MISPTTWVWFETPVPRAGSRELFVPLAGSLELLVPLAGSRELLVVRAGSLIFVDYEPILLDSLPRLRLIGFGECSN